MDIAEIIKNSGKGKDLDLAGADQKTLAVVGLALDATMQEIEAKQTEAVTAAVSAAIDGLKTEVIAPLTTKLDALSKTTEPKAKDDPKTTSTDEPPAWAKGLIESVTNLTTEREAERAQRATAERVDAYLATKRPNLAPERAKVLREQLLAAKPADDKAIEQQVQAFEANLKAFGVDVDKAFGASTAGEGGKPGTDTTDPKAEAEAKVEELRSHRMRLLAAGGNLN